MAHCSHCMTLSVVLLRPYARFGILPVGGRSTAVKMTNGGVWVLMLTALNSETKAKIDELGPVQYIISSDAEHHLILGEFKKAYPTDKQIAPSAVIARADKTLVFDGGATTHQTLNLSMVSSCSLSQGSRTAPLTDYSYFSDVAFFHLASATLIQADLIFNLPCTEQYSKTNSSGAAPFIGSLGPSSWLHRKFAVYGGVHVALTFSTMKRDVKTVADWDFQRIIPCHGDIMRETGVARPVQVVPGSRVNV
ncbi:hypothetical protein FB451DRAFT_1393024 [Mycena latifolia]|nr:hypothetical protein FB451DRAFT_1393024 [Mycena latifolia]